MTGKEKVRVALVGGGAMANKVHYPSLHEMKDVDMVAISDLDPQKARATAEAFGIPKIFGDYRKMLEETMPDAVYCIMPAHHLYDILVDVLKRKHAVFIEKPPGVSLNQTRQLARHAEENGCLTMTGFQRRFCPVIVEAQRRVREHGPLNQCLARFIKPNAQPYKEGALDRLTVDAIHSIDQLRAMGGEVKKVASVLSGFNSKMDNGFNALLEFESGAVGILEANFLGGSRIYSVEMHAKNISAYAEPDDKAVIYTHVDGKSQRSEISTAEAAGSEQERHYVGFFAENRHFIDCVKSGSQPQTNFADGVKTMELVDRIAHSQL